MLNCVSCVNRLFEKFLVDGENFARKYFFLHCQLSTFGRENSLIFGEHAKLGDRRTRTCVNDDSVDATMTSAAVIG